MGVEVRIGVEVAEAVGVGPACPPKLCDGWELAEGEGADVGVADSDGAGDPEGVACGEPAESGEGVGVAVATGLPLFP